MNPENVFSFRFELLIKIEQLALPCLSAASVMLSVLPATENKAGGAGWHFHQKVRVQPGLRV